MFVLLDQTDDPPMAKKKSEPPKRMGRPPLEEGAKDARFSLRVKSEWLEWFGRYANSKRKDKAVIVREAVEKMAKADDFEAPPKEIQ